MAGSIAPPIPPPYFALAMSSGLLDFFTLEASEYVEHLDGLVARAAGGPPELEGFLRSARALRGSATMAKVGGVADVAAALERVAHALQAGVVPWSAVLRGAAVAAIDDLKILIRGVRSWGDKETARAAARTHELAGYAPAAAAAGSAAPHASVFLATEADEIARRLSEFAENPTGPSAFAATLQRVRGLRGIALLKDIPPFPEVVDALDQAAKSFEMGGAVTPALRALFFAASHVLGDGSTALLRGTRPSTESAALTAFAAAAAAFGGGASQGDDVVPISTLFPDDGAPGLVSAAPTPPTTAAGRFRTDVLSHAEHLRALAGDAARAVDFATRERLGRELGTASQALARMATSFGESSLAAFFAEQREPAAQLEMTALAALDLACQLLTTASGVGTAEILQHVSAAVDSWRQAPGPLHAPAPVPLHSTVPLPLHLGMVDIGSLAPTDAPSLVSSGATSSGEALHALLERGIDGLSALDDAPLVEPVAYDDDVTVPIEDLVYRGRDALERAIELRDVLRQDDGPPDAAMLAELFDLLELAATTE